MHSRGLAKLLVGCAAVYFCPAVLGSTIYTTGGSPILFSPLLVNSWQMGPGQSFGAVAESFVPSATQVLGQIEVAVQAVSGTGNLVVEIARNSSGAPGTILETLTGTAPGTPQIVTLSSLLHPTLAAGTTYWLVVTQTGSLDLAWFVNAVPRGVDFTLFGSGTWINSTGASKGAADILSGAAVPEPGTAGLLGVALLGGWLVRRRKNN